MLRHLDCVIPEDPPRPERAGGDDHPMRAVTRQVAFDADGTGWTAERRAKVAALFDGLAPEWHTHLDSPQRTAPLTDAYERGGIIGTGTCLEVGSGDGANTDFLTQRHATVVAADLSIEMLRRASPSSGNRVRADTHDTPIRTASIDVVVLVNALLFPSEMARVLTPGGALVWVNTAGDQTPIHLSADEIVEALPGAWDGVASEAGRGTWTVLHRV